MRPSLATGESGARSLASRCSPARGWRAAVTNQEVFPQRPAGLDCVGPRELGLAVVNLGFPLQSEDTVDVRAAHGERPPAGTTGLVICEPFPAPTTELRAATLWRERVVNPAQTQDRPLGVFENQAGAFVELIVEQR